MVHRRNVPSKGEIWHTSSNSVSGREFKGAHYYLVISEFALNQKLGTALCVPITSGGGIARSEAVTVYLDGSSTDTGKITGVVLCYQIRSLDLNERKATYSAQAEPSVVDEVLAKVIDILDPQLN
ncbi:type II toxin-antitoxin system PemK/MazF family toxin [Xenorhabdus budapestensis]|uniref:Type II toxin-antitoxin system PemK/MazF family toxin n=1 Tax=Xenorhabdus budapestensis TaxID=290110 RepID=A0A2D0J659_XENBU|nr:type II toxin-antitoxin system PemK/MazF family toxin [Xenorhabdus budapestensis]PHM29966.1 mRNA interferase PemK [Xenorhabdus budapestensis]QTL38734.1 type II toxin-antitoxin system PemK/MazF family toxin [Xenorhabdus budapestensis]